MKERDTIILPIRIKKTLFEQVKQRVMKTGKSRNAWLLKAIQEGLRSHKRKDGNGNQT